MNEKSKRTRTENNCRFKMEYSPEKVLELMGTHPITTSQIKLMLGNCSTSTAYNKLQILCDAGKITKNRAGQIWLWQKIQTPMMNSYLIEAEG